MTRTLPRDSVTGGGIESISVARSLDDVEQLRTDWSRLRFGRVDAELDFYLAVIAARPHVLRPHVVSLRRRGRVEAMAVARVEDVRLTSSVGYRAVYEPTVRSLTLVHGGLAGIDSPAVANALLRSMRASLSAGEVELLSLPALRSDAPFHTVAVEQSARLLRERSSPATHRRLRLPGSLDEFLSTKSGKTRESVKRYAKRLRKDHGEHLSVEVIREPTEVDRLFRDLGSVAAKTYQSGLGVAFADTPEQRSLTMLGLERGWFRAYVLSLDETPIAFWPGYAYGDTFFIGTPGYDPAFARYRVGQYLQAEMIDHLCRDETVDYLDYGFGDAEYKRRFGNESWEEADVLFFAPTFAGVRRRAVRAGVGAAASAAKRLLGGERSARLKKAWRDRLAGDPAR